MLLAMKKVWAYAGIMTILFIVALGGVLALVYISQDLSYDKLQSHTRVSQIYDNSDKLVIDNKDFKNVRLDKLPDHVPNAFVAVEDKNFYNHKGISVGRIIKAGAKNIKSGHAKEGASTISQQLIKNTHLSHEKTLKRKVREASLAHKLEKRYGKSEILEMYLNAIYFGNGIYGLEGASWFYFGKPACDLGVKEAASLAGMLRSPARYCPISNFDNFQERGIFVMRLMIEQGFIEKMDESNLEISARKDTAVARSYKVAATTAAAKHLDLSQSDLASLGYKVFTYYDDNIQKAIVETVTQPDYEIVSDVVVMSATNRGEVNGFYTNTSTLIGAKRNFASALKPLVVYTPALELGVVSPKTKVLDEPFIGGDFHPKNHDGSHRGEITVRNAVIHSVNIPAVRVLDWTRLERSVEIARRLGLDLGRENMSLSLGNAEKGISFEQLLGGYCAISSGGIRVNPSLIKRIEDRDGNVVWRHMQPTQRVIGDDTAFLVTDMLVDTVKHGTARKLAELDFAVAAKTGTAERENSTTNTDAVCVAFTPKNSLVVWLGNASMQREKDLPKGTTGGGVTTFIARDILKTIGSGGEFEIPQSVERGESDYYSLRYPPKSESRFVVPTLDGRVRAGQAMIWFPTLSNQTYEIYRNNQLQEVIKDKSGEYQFLDTKWTAKESVEYHVLTGEEKTNTVKLFPDGNKADKPLSKRRHWFF